MSRARACFAAVLAAVAWAIGCGDVVSQPIGAGASVTDSGTGTEGGVVDAPLNPDVRADAPSFCTLSGPIGVPGTSVCLGDLATVFRFAACACNSLAVSGTLAVDTSAVAADGGPTGADVASIAANGAVSTNAQTTVAGSVWAGGAGAQGAPAVTLRDFGFVAHDVQSGSAVEIGGNYTVGGNVWANGNVTLDPSATLAVHGTVHVPAGDTATGVQGNVVTGPVQVGAPCNCTQLVDVGAVVSAFASNNDDATISPPFSSTTTLDGTVALPCGRYYVAAVAGAVVTLQVQGRVALLVDGDVNVTQALTVQLAPGAELDFVVKGGFSVMGTLAVGDAGQAARTRLYVGGPTLALSATAKPLAADVYAPNATLQLASDLEMWGAIFAQTMQFSGAFLLHYDPSALAVAQSGGCAPPGGSCTTCDQCPAAAPACKSGTCGPCATTADCCVPLVCAPDGRCVLGTQ